MFETSALEYLYGGWLTRSTQLIKPIYLVNTPNRRSTAVSYHTWNSSFVVDKADKNAEAQETGDKTQNDHWNLIMIIIVVSAIYIYKQNNTSVKRKGRDPRERQADKCKHRLIFTHTCDQ